MYVFYVCTYTHTYVGRKEGSWAGRSVGRHNYIYTGLVCIYVCIYIYMCIYICIYIYLYLYIYECVSICAWMCLYMCITHKHAYAGTHTHVILEKKQELAYTVSNLENLKPLTLTSLNPLGMSPYWIVPLRDPLRVPWISRTLRLVGALKGTLLRRDLGP